MQSLMLQEEKKTLRKQMKKLSQEQQVSPTVFGLKQLFKQIQMLSSFTKARAILLYAPLPGEPDLRIILGNSSRRFFFPRMQKTHLELYEWSPQAPWIVGPYGVEEPDPQQWQKASLAEVDLALIPGIAFDPKGHRLGRGAGYFDRLLGDSSCHAIKVGIAWSWQILTNIPIEEYDVKMDFVVTPEKIFHSE